MRAFRPGLVTGRFYETWDFYTEVLGFRTVCEWDNFVRLRHPSGPEIEILKEEVDGQPSELVSATDGRGFWLTLEVDDAVREYARLLRVGAGVIGIVEEKPWGSRQFTVRDPNGVLIYLAERLHDRVAERVAERTLA